MFFVKEIISIHALREEGDNKLTPEECQKQKFLSTPSARRATAFKGCSRKLQDISIHALREEGDALLRGKVAVTENFYPRPPRGGRPIGVETHRQVAEFLSTPSARRATDDPEKYPDIPEFLSTPSARRATARRR